MTSIPKTMRALVKESPTRGYTLKEDVEVPSPGPDEVLVRVERVSLCGSDILLYNWGAVAQTIAQVPFIPGHEGCGLVVARGAHVTDAQCPLGARVSADTHIACERCYQCKHAGAPPHRNDKHICQHMGLYGHGSYRYGFCSEYTVVPLNALYVFRSQISSRDAALMEPFGCAYRTVSELRGGVAQDTLLVCGAGPIGLAAAAIAKQAFHARKIIALDISDTRLQIGKQVGVDVIVNTKDMTEEEIYQRLLSETDGDGPGKIIECSGASIMVNNVFKWCRKGGSISMLGLPKEPMVPKVIKDAPANFIFKELTVKTFHGRRIFDTWESLEPLFNGVVNFDPIITHYLELEDVDKAFDLIAQGVACKVQLRLLDEEKVTK